MIKWFKKDEIILTISYLTGKGSNYPSYIQRKPNDLSKVIREATKYMISTIWHSGEGEIMKMMKDQWFPGVRGEKRMNRQSAKVSLGQWNSSV